MKPTKAQLIAEYDLIRWMATGPTEQLRQDAAARMAAFRAKLTPEQFAELTAPRQKETPKPEAPPAVRLKL